VIKTGKTFNIYCYFGELCGFFLILTELTGRLKCTCALCRVMQSEVIDTMKQNYLKSDQTSISANFRKYIVEKIQKHCSQEFYFNSGCYGHIYAVGSEALLKSKGPHGLPQSGKRDTGLPSQLSLP